MQDRFGLPITTSSATAAEHYQKGLDLVLSQNFGAEDAFQKAIEADDGFALAPSCMAYMAMQRGRGAEAREIIKGVQSLSSSVSKRERQQIEAVARAYGVFSRKSDEDPDDPENYLNDHTATTFLMGPDGKFETFFRNGATAESVAPKIRSFF